jgi:hypothetical protein
MDDLVANTAQVEIWRERLADLGWIMKALKEDIAKRANKEDGCSGAFWEGRFKSVPQYARWSVNGGRCKGADLYALHSALLGQLGAVRA